MTGRTAWVRWERCNRMLELRFGPRVEAALWPLEAPSNAGQFRWLRRGQTRDVAGGAGMTEAEAMEWVERAVAEGVAALTISEGAK